METQVTAEGFSPTTPMGNFSICTYTVQPTKCGLPAIHVRMEVWNNGDGAEIVIDLNNRTFCDGVKTSSELRAVINCGGISRKRNEIFRKFDAFAASTIAAMGFEFKA